MYTIQMQRRSSNRQLYVVRCHIPSPHPLPRAGQVRFSHVQMPEGRELHSINKAWEKMEREENHREVALRTELARLELLDQTAAKFSRKAGLREVWLKDMQALLAVEGIHGPCLTTLCIPAPFRHCFVPRPQSPPSPLSSF
jgi:hypothetical protein